MTAAELAGAERYDTIAVPAAGLWDRAADCGGVMEPVAAPPFPIEYLQKLVGNVF